MQMILQTLLILGTLATPFVGAASCSFTDLKGTSKSTRTAKGTQKLSCKSGQIDITQSGLTRSFDELACVAGEWYGLSCDGTAASLSADVSVSCAVDPAVRTCAFRGVADGFPPITKVVDGVEVKMCGDGKTINVQGLAANLNFTRATCMADGGWFVFNCDGTVEKVTDPLAAYCDSEPTPPTPACSPLGVYDNDECAAKYLAEGRLTAKCAAASSVTTAAVTCSDPAYPWIAIVGGANMNGRLNTLICDAVTNTWTGYYAPDNATYPQATIEAALGGQPFRVACAYTEERPKK